jgi:hypothetical protein
MNDARQSFTDADLDREISLFNKLIQRPWILDPKLLEALIEHYSVEPLVSKAHGERRDLLEALHDYLEEVRDVRRKGVKDSWLNRQSRRLRAALQKLDLEY